MSTSSSSSHAQWQGSARWKQGWSGARKGWDDSSATTSPVQNPEQISDERVTTAMHTMQDHLQQTTSLSQRHSQRTLSEQFSSRTNGDAAHEATEAVAQARERQAETRRLHEQTCQDPAEAETIFNGAIKDTLENTEALEKHVKRQTMREESCTTTEADFFETLFDHPEGHTTPFSTQSKLRSARKEDQLQTSTSALLSTHTRFSLPACQVDPSLKSGGLNFVQRELQGNSHVRSTSFALRAQFRAALSMERRPDGTKLSRH